MGYQESYMYLKGFGNQDFAFDKVLDIFRKHGIRTKDDLFCSCDCIVTLKQNAKSDLGIAGGHKIFKEGTKFLYFSGERDWQRSNGTIFRDNEVAYTPAEKMLIARMRVIPAESMPSERIFNDKSMAHVEELSIVSEQVKTLMDVPTAQEISNVYEQSF